MTTAHPDDWSLRNRQPGQSALEKAQQLRADGAPDHEVRPWEIGAHGERIVGRLLAQLHSDWTVLHDVPLGKQGANIDHVLIGPEGVFTINTKHHPRAKVEVTGGQIMVRGQRQQYASAAITEAYRTSENLSICTGRYVFVQPIVLFVGIESMTVHRDPSRVMVATDETILGLLNSQQVSLTPERLQAIIFAAVQPETWTGDAYKPITPSARQRVPYGHHPAGARARMSARGVAAHRTHTPHVPPSRVPDYRRQMPPKKDSLSALSVAGIVFGALFVTLFVLAILAAAISGLGMQGGTTEVDTAVPSTMMTGTNP